MVAYSKFNYQLFWLFVAYTNISFSYAESSGDDSPYSDAEVPELMDEKVSQEFESQLKALLCTYSTCWTIYMLNIHAP